MPAVKYKLDKQSTEQNPRYICGFCSETVEYDDTTRHANTHNATSISIDTNFEKLRKGVIDELVQEEESS